MKIPVTAEIQRFNAAVEEADALTQGKYDTLGVWQLVHALKFAAWRHPVTWSRAAERIEKAARTEKLNQTTNDMIAVTKPTIKHARSILSLMAHGLAKGIGKPKPGEMCILAVKRNVFGLSHGDSCDGLPVGHAVRSFDIALNDSSWSGNAARAKGMRRLAIAEFGSDTIDQNQFVKELALATIRQIVPLALRAAAGMEGNAEHKESLFEHANKCEAAKELEAGRAAADAAAADAARYAARYAADAARYAADAARYAADAADAARYAAAAAARYAAAAADATRDKVLTLMANIAVEALRKCGSPGCKWLYLCDEKETKCKS